MSGAVNYGKTISATVQPLATWRHQIGDAPPCRLGAIMNGGVAVLVDSGLLVTASIGVNMLWRYPVAPSKLVNLKEVVAHDFRRRRADEGKTALPEEVAVALDILVLMPGLFFTLYLNNPTDRALRFEGVLMGKVIR